MPLLRSGVIIQHKTQARCQVLLTLPRTSKIIYHVSHKLCQQLWKEKTANFIFHIASVSRNRYLVHRSEVGSIVAGCTGTYLARGNVMSEEHVFS